MNQCGLACHTIELVNDTINVSSGVDWVAVIALIVSLITFKLKWNDRKKDRKEQQDLREQDKKEQIERTKKEDEIRQWNALYPHRLDFYSGFYDDLYKLLQLHKDMDKRTLSLAETKIPSQEMYSLLNAFKRYKDTAMVLFNSTIHTEVSKVYDILNEYISCPYKSRDAKIAEKQEAIWFFGLNNNEN